MKRRFNITGLCIPSKHYMVDLSGRLEEIRGMIDEGLYFSINRGRQFGKTTLLHALTRALSDRYLVVHLDFQALGSASYKDENTFSLAFASIFARNLSFADEHISEVNPVCQTLQKIDETSNPDFDLRRLFYILLAFCKASKKPVVLIIDEIDSASNNQVFLDFLAQLRNYYLEREALGTITFQSVILAGVYDIRNLKRKIRTDDEHKLNSPWNIAAKFNIRMSFSKEDIADMLKDYEEDYHTCMDIDEIAGFIYDDTSGYPYLVSAFCKLIDEELIPGDTPGAPKTVWTKAGFLQAERMLLEEKNTLFDSLIGKLTDFPELDTLVKNILFAGTSTAYNSDLPAVDIAAMFGFIKKRQHNIVIANRIFETRLYNYYLSAADMQEMDIYKASQRDKSQFIIDGHLNMRRILEKFTEHFHDLYKDSPDTFIEDTGRKFFLLYLRPIINGTGNYYIESQTRDYCRTDVIVDYHGEQFIIETKIWHGNEYNKRGEQQLIDYLNAYHQTKGYMLSFNFNKKKQIGVHDIVIGDKVIIEAVV